MNGDGRMDDVGEASSASEARLRVSALMDAELDDAAAAAAIDELLASHELARFWGDAHRAGDWLRSDEVVATGGICSSDVFMRRFAVALESEPSIVAPGAIKRSGTARRFWVRTALPGASIAAALVAVAWVAGPIGQPGPQTIASSTIRPVQVDRREESVGAKTVGATHSEVVDARQSEPGEWDGASFRDLVDAHRDVTPFGYRGATSRQATFVVGDSTAGASR